MQLKELKELVKHSGIYGAGMMLSKTVSFLMIPVYTRYLAPQDYGVMELLDLLIFAAAIIAATGITGAVFRFYSAYESDKDKKEVVSTALLYTAVASFLVSFLIFILARPFAQLLFGKPGFDSFVRMGACILFFSNVAEVPQAYWRAQGRSRLYVGVGVVRAVFGAAILAFFLVVLKGGLRGAIQANLISQGVAGIGLFVVVLASLPKRIYWDKLGPMLKYGVPLIPWSLNLFVLTFSDRFFVRHFGTLADVGVYALGYKFAMVVALVVNGPFLLAWQWQQFELAKQQDGSQIYAKVESYLLFLSLLVGLGVSILARDVLHVIAPPSYWSAASVVPLIALSYVLSNIRYVVESGMYVKRTTHYLSYIAVVVAVSNLVLNYFFIARYLVMGAALATAISYALNLLLCYAVSQRVYHVPYEYTRNAIVIGAAVLLYLVSTWQHSGGVISLAVDLGLLVLFLLLVLLLLSSSERNNFLRLGSDITQRLVHPRVQAQ